jgi:hypothetical protein
VLDELTAANIVALEASTCWLGRQDSPNCCELPEAPERSFVADLPARKVPTLINLNVFAWPGKERPHLGQPLGAQDMGARRSVAPAMLFTGQRGGALEQRAGAH